MTGSTSSLRVILRAMSRASPSETTQVMGPTTLPHRSMVTPNHGGGSIWVVTAILAMSGSSPTYDLITLITGSMTQLTISALIGALPAALEEVGALGWLIESLATLPERWSHP